MKRLILTRLDPVAEDGRAVHLGPWSLSEAEHRSGAWSRYGFQRPLPSEAVAGTASALEAVSEYLLAGLREELNARHRTNRSIRFWRILLMPWLIWLAMCVFERYLRLRGRAGEGIPYEVFLSPPGERLPLDSTRHFRNLLQDDSLNRLVLTRIIEDLRPPGWVLRPGPPAAPEGGLVSVNRRRKLALVHWASLLASNLGRVQFCMVYGMTLWDTAALALRLALRPGRKLESGSAGLRWQSPPVPSRTEAAEGLESAAGLAGGEGERFLRILEGLSKETLPKTFAEDFPREVRLARAKLALTAPWTRAIVCGPALGADDEAKFYIAHMVELRGAALIGHQHGGNYGLMETFTYVNQTEYQTCDRYLSWGWEAQSGYPLRAVPAASPLLSKLRRGGERNGSLLLVTNEPPLYTQDISSNLFPEDVEKYREDQAVFVHALEEGPRASLVYRPYMSRLGRVYGEAFMRERFPGLQLFKGTLSRNRKGWLSPFVAGCRACVVDHPGTTAAMTLAARIPTVLFWDEDVWRTQGEQKRALDGLRAAGVFHGTPESAARHLNAVWPDVEAWWGDPRSREAVDRFAHSYCRSNPGWMKEWEALLASPDSPLWSGLGGSQEAGRVRSGEGEKELAGGGARRRA
ncbi:MAG: hypothetical protein HYZ11_00210 [Candidatus Tectomicrobia bacterium]|uniref:Transferase, LIC12162 family n=1 Tax=Tectimicrobiota bacterium TaxID=2528274 RepID=A0A932MKY6_UNCTE|nr:hypothetical protein [Candidatus Tectomicrobia bacterium]